VREPRVQLGRPEQRKPRRRQLDGQRQAVEAAADAGDRGDVDARAVGLRALEEERACRAAPDVAGRLAGREIERLDGQPVLGP
jgi:hypothetical protein